MGLVNVDRFSDEKLFPPTREGVQGVGPFDADGNEYIDPRTPAEVSESILASLRTGHEAYIAQTTQRLVSVLARLRQIRAEDERDWFIDHKELGYSEVEVRQHGHETRVVTVAAAVEIGDRRVGNLPEDDLYEQSKQVA
jgi:hypothetical protein